VQANLRVTCEVDPEEAVGPILGQAVISTDACPHHVVRPHSDEATVVMAIVESHSGTQHQGLAACSAEDVAAVADSAVVILPALMLGDAGVADAMNSARAAVGLAAVAMPVVARIARGAVVVDMSVPWVLAGFAVAAAAGVARLDLEHVEELRAPIAGQRVRVPVRAEATIAVVAHLDEAVLPRVVQSDAAVAVRIDDREAFGIPVPRQLMPVAMWRANHVMTTHLDEAVA